MEAVGPRPNTGDMFHIFVFVLGVALIVLAAATGTPAALYLAAGVFCGILIALATIAATHKADLSLFLLIPTIMSAFQNVYLSPFAHEMSQSALQVAIIINFVYSILLYLSLLVLRPTVKGQKRARSARIVTVLMVVMVAHGLGLMALHGHDIQAAMASARNLIAPFLFFLIGYYASAFVDLKRYLRMVVSLGWLVLVASAVEYSVSSFWPAIGLHNLWELKGIDVTVNSLLPKNFYASEQVVPGEFIRRMAGPFADPVNFGTFLFAVICVAWFMRSRLLIVATLVATVLTVSKGAFLGLLTFTAVWAKKFRSMFEFVVLTSITVAAGLYFYAFTQSSSTGSTDAHIGGLVAAFVELPEHPAGRGFGGTGVLAGLFRDEGAESGSAIVESGLGMVLGQLGVLGLAIFVTFFAVIIRAVHRIRDTRTYVLGMALVLAFVLNAAFNEVAFSPNSCAIYFVVLGLLVAASDADRPQAVPRRSAQLAGRSAARTHHVL